MTGVLVVFVTVRTGAHSVPELTPGTVPSVPFVAMVPSDPGVAPKGIWVPAWLVVPFRPPLTVAAAAACESTTTPPPPPPPGP